MISCWRLIGGYLALVCLLGIFQWRWDRVPDLDVVDYRIEVAYKDPSWYPCSWCDEDGNCFGDLCVVWGMSAWSLADTFPQQSEDTICADWDSDGPGGSIIPPLGSVLFVNVRARDAAGNIGG